MTKKERKKVGKLQHIIGSMRGIYHNDRSENRADMLEPLFKEGFDICLSLLSKYPPDDEE